MTGPAETGAPRRRLERSRRERWIAGVSGGLARYFNIDPVIVRLAFIALTFAGGVGIVAYAVAWLIVPEEGSQRTLLQACLSRSDRWAVITGAVLVGVGAIVLLGTLDLWFDGGGVFWSLLLLGAGAWLLLRHTDAGRSLGLTGPRAASAGAGPAAAPPPAGPTAPGGGEAPTTPLPAAGDATDATGAATPPVGPRRRRRRTATRVALGAVMAVCGAGGLLVAADVIDVGWDTYVAASVVVIGLALVASAWFGGSPALIWIGLSLAAALGTVVAADVDLDGGVGDRVYRPASGADVRPEYQLGVGRLWIDLRDTALSPGTTRVKAKIGVGELTVVVPDGVRVVSEGSVGMGELRLLGGHKDGIDIDQTATATGGPGPRPRTVVIDGDVGIGEMRVFQGADSPQAGDDDRERRSG